MTWNFIQVLIKKITLMKNDVIWYHILSYVRWYHILFCPTLILLKAVLDNEVLPKRPICLLSFNDAWPRTCKNAQTRELRIIPMV